MLSLVYQHEVGRYGALILFLLAPAPDTGPIVDDNGSDMDTEVSLIAHGCNATLSPHLSPSLCRRQVVGQRLILLWTRPSQPRFVTSNDGGGSDDPQQLTDCRRPICIKRQSQW